MGNERFHISHSKPHMVVNFYQSSHIFQREGENLYPAFIQCVTPITFHLNLFFYAPLKDSTTLCLHVGDKIHTDRGVIKRTTTN